MYHNLGTISSISSYPKTQTKYHQLWHVELRIHICKDPDNHPHIQRSRQCNNFGKMNSIPAYPKKKEQSTNVGRMSSASSIQKKTRKYQHCQNELCILISKKLRQRTNFGRMCSASSYPKPPTKYQLWQVKLCTNFGRTSSSFSFPKTQT